MRIRRYRTHSRVLKHRSRAARLIVASLTIRFLDSRRNTKHADVTTSVNIYLTQNKYFSTLNGRYMSHASDRRFQYRNDTECDYGTQRVVGEPPVLFLATVINNTNIDTEKLGNSVKQTCNKKTHRKNRMHKSKTILILFRTCFCMMILVTALLNGYL